MISLYEHVFGPSSLPRLLNKSFDGGGDRRTLVAPNESNQKRGGEELNRIKNTELREHEIEKK